MHVYLRAISYFKQDWLKIILLLGLIGASILLSLLWPFPLAILIDSVLGTKPSYHWLYQLFFAMVPSDDKTTQIIVLAAAMFALRMLGEVARFAHTLVSIRIGYNGLMRVRCDLFRKLQELSLAYHRSQPQGDTIYRLSYDTLGFQGVLNVVIGMLVNVVTLLVMAWFMLGMNWKLTLVAIAIVPLLLLTMHGYGRMLKARYTQSYEVDSQLTTAIQRSVASIGLVQAFGRERDEYTNFLHTVGRSIAVKLKLHWDEVMYWLILGTIFAVGAAAIFGYGGLLVYRGALGVGGLTIFLFYLEKLYEPLKSLSGSGSSLQGGLQQVRRVIEVLDRDPIIRDTPDAIPLPRIPRKLQLDRVGFEYRPGEAVLRDVTVSIDPGQMVAFVGSSGVGKTTLLNLLPRFYDPTRGALHLDGTDLKQIKLADLRKHIALVLQEGVILPTTVAENIAYGRPDASDTEIQRAAELAGAGTFIDKLPQKYDTEISEAGQNLSGGQRQRIAIARALLTEAPILVLDEPTSALDAANEQMITQTLRELKGKRTIILVSHRLSTVADCDQIFVMDEGRIVEQGTHAQLVSRGGLYFNMAKHQLKLQAPQEAEV